MAKSVLVTGATGFVGSNLVRKLLQDGYQVSILTRKDSNKWRLADILPDVDEHSVDLSDGEKLKETVKKIKPEIIFHLATHSIFSAYTKEEDDGEIFKTNCLGLINLLKACQPIDYCCFINTGTSSEYGLKSEPMKEIDLCQPANVYGISKLAATNYSYYVAQIKNKPIITFRLFSPFGPADDKRRLIPHVILGILANQEINVTNPDVVRDYIYVDNIIDLYLKAAEFGGLAGVKGEVFNAGSGLQVTIKEVVDQIVSLTNYEGKINWSAVDRRAWEPEMWQADLTKIKKTFDWQPKTSLQDGLEKTIEWFRQNLKNYA